MKKILKYISLASAVILIMLASACGETESVEDKKLKVVCTVYPFYDWTVNIAGSQADVELIVSGSTDMHSYQPSAYDMVKIA